MYEHPSDIYHHILVEQERIDRANELRRFIAEHPEQVITRKRSVWASMRDRAGPALPLSAARMSVVRGTMKW